MSHDHHHDHNAGHGHAEPHAHADGAACGHAHGHFDHTHAPKNFGRAFAIGIALNAGFVVIEAGYGFAANSVALLADAGHNLSDVLGLVIAWAASVLAARPPSTRYTYGLRGSSILAAMLNALLLLVAVGGIVWEAVHRIVAPEPVAGMTVIVVAAIGIAINGFTAWLFASGRKGDLNIRGAYLHMAADAAVSVGVVVAGLVILQTGWLWLDPAVSLAIAGVIVWSTWGLLRESVALSLSAIPAQIDRRAVENYLAAQPGVAALHDLHIWALSTTEVALTAHLVMPDGPPGDAFLLATADALKQRFGIAHATMQIEARADAACRLVPETVV